MKRFAPLLLVLAAGCHNCIIPIPGLDGGLGDGGETGGGGDVGGSGGDVGGGGGDIGGGGGFAGGGGITGGGSGQSGGAGQTGGGIPTDGGWACVYCWNDNNMCVPCPSSVPDGGGILQSCPYTCFDTTADTCIPFQPASSSCTTSNGVCFDCSQSPVGHLCLGSNRDFRCGCSGAADCPSGYACDMSTGTCTNSCEVVGIIGACNGGCCALGLVSGQNYCVPGDQQRQCGGAGGVCSDCALSSLGQVCISGHCGCDSPSDCPNANATCTSGHLCQ
jgi:hypothetical protein